MVIVVNFTLCIFHHNFRKESREERGLTTGWPTAQHKPAVPRAPSCLQNSAEVTSGLSYLPPRALSCTCAQAPPPFLLPRCVSRCPLPTEEPSPLSALHLQGSAYKLFPELSPINPTCRGGWATISPALYEILGTPDPSTIFFFFPNVKSASRSPSIIMCPYSTPNAPDLQVQSLLTTHGAHKVPFYPPGISQLPSARHFHALPHPPTSQWPEPR